MNLSKDQVCAKEAIDDFIDYGDRTYLTLHGLAGTGKSFLLSLVAKERPEAIPCAYTGKAAYVLRKKTGLDVSTIHSVIYDFKGLMKDDEDEHKRHPIFSAKHQQGALSGRLVFIDEVSMVGHTLARDLLDTGARLVTSGDPGQLPPVRDKQFFVNPDVTLKEIHRQAWDSPIIRQAHNIRNTGAYAAEGEYFQVTSEMKDALLFEHDIALCHENKSRIWLNTRSRKILGYGSTLRAGEPVMLLKNDHALKIYNGMVFTLVQDRAPGDPFIIQDDLGKQTMIIKPTVEMIDVNFPKDQYDDSFSPFAISYACTVHKAQGSEYKNVLMIDDYRHAAGRRNFLYTGITRAIERVTVVRRW